MGRGTPEGGQPNRNPAQDGLPADFVARTKELEDAIGEPLLQPLASRTHAGVRIRTLRGNGKDALATLDGEGIHHAGVADLPHGLIVPLADRDRLVRCAPVADGRLYVQGISSQRVGMQLDVGPDMKVLDLAAAPGGKTLVLADQMEDQGELHAVEKVRSRFFKLQDTIRTAGAKSVRTACMDGRKLPAGWAESFHRVLLDAPCSAEARIDPAEPVTFAKWSVRKVREMASKQFRMLGAALRVLRPGGEMIYATCSLAPEENEAQLAAWLDRQDPPVEILPLDLGEDVPQAQGITRWLRKSWPEDVRSARRILPDGIHEAMFLARLRRRAESHGKDGGARR